MDKIAIDIALLPPEDVMDTVIELNQTHDPIVNLNKVDRLPHITLVQAVVDTDDLPEITDKLAALAQSIPPLNLKAELTHNPDFYRIHQQENLLRLHEQCMHAIERFASDDVQAKYYFDKDVRQKSIDWIRNFVANSAFEKYDPHITIAANQSIASAKPLVFIVDRLVICHLGDYSTCRKILFETKLTGK